MTVHSMLHLLGYDHEGGGLEALRMREKEELVLTRLGLQRDNELCGRGRCPGIARTVFCVPLRAAGSGIWQAIRQERNLRFHLAAAALVLYGRSFYSFSAAEDAALFLTMGSVIAAELVNTAVERAVDLCCPRPNPLAKLAKDAAAGAVLVLAHRGGAGGTAAVLAAPDPAAGCGAAPSFPTPAAPCAAGGSRRRLVCVFL